jgi:hypothetical protein
MKTRKVISLSLAALLALGCEDFLEKPLQGNLTQENFPTTASDLQSATIAIYHTLRFSTFNDGLFPITDIMSDDAHKGSNPTDQASTIGPYDKFEHIANEESPERWWSALYTGVRRANTVIEYAPRVPMGEAEKQRLVGEAKFLRALFYFDLVRAFGGVPKVLTALPPSGLTRTTRDEIYDLIEQDLLAAIAVLPRKSARPAADLGRATQGAAQAYLAKVYLFQNDFANAELYALEVINSGEYRLEPNFEDANSVAGEHGVESVFEVGSVNLVNVEGIENGGNQYGNVQAVRGNPNRGWGFNRPSLDLLNAFAPNDPRREATVIRLGEVIDGIVIVGDGLTPDETIVNGNVVEVECYNQKVWTPGVNVPPSFGHNRRLMRYADVLLMAAEALNQNNNPTQALQYVNAVRARARAGNPAVLPDLVFTSREQLNLAILNERRFELALEGHRFWDLVRTGRAPAVLGPLGFQAGKHELLAIPQTEIDLTQGLLTQNPGW